MRSKLLIALTAVLLIGAQAGKNSPAIKDIEEANRALNEAFTKRDAEAIRRLTAEEHVAITSYYGGRQTTAEQLKTLPDLQVTEYAVGEVTVNLLTADVALVTFPLNQNGKFKQIPLARKNYVSSVWVRRNGKWLEASYQETPLSGQ